MKTLMYEVYRNEDRDYHDACASIGEFLKRIYNQKRLHSACGIFHRPSSRTVPRHEIRVPATKRGLCPATPGFTAVPPE
jgi:hypothetical protein